MRATIVFTLGLALLAGACDRASAPNEQGEANVAAEDASAPAPDEAVASAPSAAGTYDRSHKGEAAPAFGFTDPDGKAVTLAAYKGKPVLLNLWATWCAPCVKEMPTLDALAAKAGTTLHVIALSQDLDAAKVQPFWTKGGYKALRPSSDPKLAFSTGLGANLPTTILYDAAGREVWRFTGSAEWNGEEAAKMIGEAS